MDELLNSVTEFCDNEVFLQNEIPRIQFNKKELIQRVGPMSRFSTS